MNMKQGFSNVFIVDDDDFWTELLKGTLNDMGVMSVKTFSTAIDCLKNLHKGPELIFLDYQMDDLNGLELLKQIKRNHYDARVIFCTAHENLALACSAIRFGSMDYILKSTLSRETIDDILKNVEESIGSGLIH
jgi:DNA-binding NtrC family response regulator